ncbi:MAG: aminotransferase class I/II-fold pyridoxal phosphate-dependent enzyme [Dokdonia sp.]|jgi:aspartate/methionine/tyrosine aminotransferase
MIQAANRLNQTTEYYFSRKLKEVRGLAAAGHPIINMGIGSPDIAAPAQVTQAMITAMDDAVAHQYQSYTGIPALREAMTHFYQTHYEVSLDSESEVLPLMGSKEGIMHISMAFLNPGDQVLIPNPGYPTYRAVAQLVEATAITYDLTQDTQWLPDLKALAEQDLSRVKLMWVNYPHMPTGAKANASMFGELIAFAKAHSILIVNDNPYSFVLNDAPSSLLATPGAKEVALELNSLSKTFNMAGWRVGMLAGDASHLQQVLKVKSNMDSGMFYGIQKGAIAALSMPKTWFEEMNALYQERREALYTLVDLLGCSYDRKATGMFIWAQLPAGKTAEPFVDKLLHEKHIFIAPGTIFGSQGEGYIRFSLCVPLPKIEAAIKRFKQHK